MKWDKKDSKKVLLGIIKAAVDDRADLTSNAFWDEVLKKSDLKNKSIKDVKKHFFKLLAGNVEGLLDSNERKMLNRKLMGAKYVTCEVDSEDDDISGDDIDKEESPIETIVAAKQVVVVNKRSNMEVWKLSCERNTEAKTGPEMGAKFPAIAKRRQEMSQNSVPKKLKGCFVDDDSDDGIDHLWKQEETVASNLKFPTPSTSYKTDSTILPHSIISSSTNAELVTAKSSLSIAATKQEPAKRKSTVAMCASKPELAKRKSSNLAIGKSPARLPKEKSTQSISTSTLDPAKAKLRQIDIGSKEKPTTSKKKSSKREEKEHTATTTIYDRLLEQQKELQHKMMDTYDDMRIQETGNQEIKRLMKYYEQCIKGTGAALERSLDGISCVSHMLEMKSMLVGEGGEITFYHYLAACCSSGGYGKTATDLAMAIVRVSVIAREQVRLLSVMADCEDCTENMKSFK